MDKNLLSHRAGELYQPVTDTEIDQKTAQLLVRLNDVSHPVSRDYRPFRYIGIAAAIIIAAVSIKYLPTPAPQIKTFATERGQRAKIQLPDGSVALLAPATRIKYAAAFGKDNRDIELDGQALFTVVNSSGQPFIVKTSGAQTRVLGTSFAVRKYSADSSAAIVVAEGKVSVASKRSSAVLTTGEMVRVHGAGEIDTYANANISSALAWTRGRLEFDDTPLRDVAGDISRMYGLDIRISSPSLSTQLFTGAVDNLSARDAVSMLGAAFNVKVEQHGNTFIISER